MLYAYPCNLTPDEDGGLVATFPDIREAITGGRDHADALVMAEDALATALGGYVHQRWDIPTPSAPTDGQEVVAVPAVVAAKLALYSAMRERSISKVALGELLGISEAAVRKLADPDHRSHINQVQKALKVLGCTMAVQVTAA